MMCYSMNLSSLYYCVIMYLVFFFKQKTAYEMRISDWSSDVCSSDLPRAVHQVALVRFQVLRRADGFHHPSRPDRGRRAEWLWQVEPGGSVALGDGREFRQADARFRPVRHDLFRNPAAARPQRGGTNPDRKSVDQGKRVSVSIDTGWA